MLKLLGNEGRLLMLCLLAARGEMTAGELVSSVGLSQSALSQHLAKLREDGLVTYRRELQTLHYRISDPRAAAHPRITQGHLLRRLGVTACLRLQGAASSRLVWCKFALLSFFAIGVASVVFCAFASAQESPPYAPLSHPLKIEQVPGSPVYYVVGSPGIPSTENEGHTSNAGFVITPQGAVVFDALGTPSLGWDLLQQIAKIANQPIRYVVVSHYHADHIYGLQAFKDHSSAIIVAQERAGEYKETNEEIADERANQRLDQRREALFPWVNSDTRVVPPDITYRQRATINLGGERFVLIYAGPAHSASDMMMMVEPNGVLFAGDIVQNSRIPFHEQRRRRHSQLADGPQGGRGARSQVHHSGARAAVGCRQAGHRIHPRLHSIRTGRDGQSGGKLDRFRCRLRPDRLVELRGLPAFEVNNRGNAYRIFPEMEQEQFKKSK